METTNGNAAALFITNLQLLGFVPVKFNTGVFSKIVFDEHMFSHANNNKAFEATSRFLFHKLDATRTVSEFAKCWPMNDTDYWRQSREYRSIAYRWLDELRIKQCLPGRVTLRKSFFEDCRGEKLDAIMLAFSTYVVQKVLDRRLVIKDKQNASKHPPIRILGTASVNMSSKDKIISNLESEINRMSSAMIQDNHTMRASNETWAQVARSLTSSNDGSPAPRSIPSEHKHSAGTQWNGMHSVLSTLKSNLDKLNQENKRLRQVSAQKEEQLRRMNQSTTVSLPKILRALSAPFPIDENPVVDDLPPLNLPAYSSNETKKRVMELVDKFLASRNSKKRPHDTENEHDENIAKKLKATEREISVSPVRSLPTTPSKPSSPPPMRISQSPRRRSTLPNTPTVTRRSITERPSLAPSPSPLRQSMTRRSHTVSSPFSYISEKISPLSSSFPDYCEQVVNQMMEQFQEQRTPDNMGILSPIDNRSVASGRLSMISQAKSLHATSPHSRKLSTLSPAKGASPKETKGRKADTPELSLWDYYESRKRINVYEKSPTLRPSRPSPGVSRRSRTSFVDTDQVASPSGVSPAASSLYAYREALEEQDNAGPGLLDETEPDMFYTSDFTIRS